MLQMEDEGNHGNDDTRCFILSTLASQHISRVPCVLCNVPMLVFDRYPLIDGTFFLSPRQHSKACVEVSYVTLLISELHKLLEDLQDELCPDPDSQNKGLLLSTN